MAMKRRAVARPTPPGDDPVEAYISRFPAEVQARLQRMRATIVRAAPGATEAMKYGIPTFVLGENLVHFAAYARHIGFYPAPSAMREFAEDLRGYTCSKGAVQFPHDQPLPLGLIGKMTRYRVKEARARG